MAYRPYPYQQLHTIQFQVTRGVRSNLPLVLIRMRLHITPSQQS